MIEFNKEAKKRSNEDLEMNAIVAQRNLILSTALQKDIYNYWKEYYDQYNFILDEWYV